MFYLLTQGIRYDILNLRKGKEEAKRIMIKATADFTKSTGAVKPMHGVNNGPVYKPGAEIQDINNMKAYTEAGFPFARTHDSAFCAAYGGAHTVDVLNIFGDMKKDPYDPSNYDFACTDAYLEAIRKAGTEILYRLGTTIEHGVKKYGCRPPEDFRKYAIVCEHIIRHYNEGWANGFHYNIRYWEIWNEPDTHIDGLAHEDDPSWTGTPELFFEFFNVVHNHLKKCFPHLMIGGPAAGGADREWVDDFLESVESKTLDFFSWHRYTADPRDYVRCAETVREKLQKHGYAGAVSVLGEWNYAKGWSGQAFIDTVVGIKSLKGASFALATMACCQYADVDLLLYYDARPCEFNGMFDTDVCSVLLKGYYPFYNFNKLYRIGESVAISSEDAEIYLCAAYRDGKGGLLITNYGGEEQREKKRVDLSVYTEGGRYNVRYFLLDDEHDNELIAEETLCGTELKIEIDLPVYTCYCIQFEKKAES